MTDKIPTEINASKSDMLSSEGTIDLFHDVTKLIEEARNHVAREYNSAQVLLCWLIGERINDRLLQSD